MTPPSITQCLAKQAGPKKQTLSKTLIWLCCPS